MPSPIGHTLAGLTVHALLGRRDDVRHAAVMVVAANLPDIDFAFRLIDGRNHHQQETHSIGAALLAGLATFLVLRFRRSARAALTALAVGAAWGSHVLLDWCGSDSNPPIGIMALWPWSQEYYKSPVLVFLDVGRTPEWATVVNNAVAGAWEAAVLGPVLWAAWVLRRQRS